LPPRSPTFDLYLVTDRHQARGRDLLYVIEQAMVGGVRAIQLREKDLSGRELFYLAEKAKRLCVRYQASLFINDRVDVAMGVDADGVHLAGTSMPPDVVRDLVGEQKLIGVSTHSLLEGLEAARAGADFLLFGPVYFTPSKAPYGAPQGIAALEEMVEKIPLPVYAIGGITADNLGEVKRTGAQGVALISAILTAADPNAAARSIVAALERNSRGSDR
jgi:thiamine-phosphate pyrophosphorylase